MTSQQRLERDLPQTLGDLAIGPYPDYIDDVLVMTARKRQRPAWTFPERWLPVDLVTKAVPSAPRIPWRALGVLALLIVLLAAAVLTYVGSQQRLPDPFGRAANGLIIYTEVGDIYTADPVSGVTTRIVTGPETDREPLWSRDGTHFVFERELGGGAGQLYVARSDGSDLVPVTPETLMSLGMWSFSPDGRSLVAVAMVDGRPTILIAAADGKSEPRLLDNVQLPGTMDRVEAPTYRPHDGAEILFAGQAPTNATRGLFAVDPLTGTVRTILKPTPNADLYGATWSPDGSRIAYGLFDTLASGVSSRTHVISADGTGDVAVDKYPDTVGGWGRRDLVQRRHTPRDHPYLLR